MPLFDFLNIFKKPAELMRTPAFVPEAAKKGIPLPVPKPALNLPMTANINPPELPKPGFNPLAPPLPGAKPEMLQPVANPLPNAALTPPSLPDNPFPRAQYDTMRKVLTSGETPIDRPAMNAAREQYLSEHGQKRTLKGILGNTLLGFAQGAAASPNNPLMGGLGGAAVGGIGSAVSPKLGAEYRFNSLEAPRFEEAYGQQNAEQNMLLQQGLNMAKIMQEQAAQRRADAEARRADRPSLTPYGPDRSGVIGVDESGPRVLVRPTPKQQVLPAPKAGWITRNGQPVYLPDLSKVQPGDAPYEKANPLADLQKQKLEREVSNLTPQEEKELDAEAERRVLQAFGPQERSQLVQKYGGDDSKEGIATGTRVLGDEMKKWKELTKSALRSLGGKAVNFNLNRDQYEGGVQNLMKKHGMSRDDAWRLMQIIGFRIAQ